MNRLRLGIILAVTGIIVLAHHVLMPAGDGRLSPDTEFLIGIVFVVVGIPVLIAGARRH